MSIFMRCEGALYYFMHVQISKFNYLDQKVLVDLDSKTVAMEVGTRYGVCNNPPAESTSPSVLRHRTMVSTRFFL